MGAYFSSLHRSQSLKALTEQPFDLLVLGGGITGAGIALDAQSRGLKTALIDMQDFAQGTSSRSTKLVHGGLRYLKQLEIKLVAEVGKERAIVYRNGPHVTHPEPMLLPLIKGGSIGYWGGRIGMWVYDYLAGVKAGEKRKMLNRQDSLTKEPLLNKDLLKGGIHYYEYRTDDARLTLEILKEASARGAVILNHVKALGLKYEHEKVAGVYGACQISGQPIDIQAAKVVNACGPWVDEVDDLDRSARKNKLFLTKGTHIVVRADRFPLKQSTYFDAGKGRMIFAIPRDNKVYIGTTDTAYSGDPAKAVANQEDAEYLLKAANTLFPAVQLSLSDIESAWAGLRPLIRQEGKGPGEISRKDELFEYKSGLITIAGGKLTGYRKMAERTVNLVCKRIKESTGRSFPECLTADIKLTGGKIIGGDDFEQYCQRMAKEAISKGIPEDEALCIARIYGSNAEQVYKLYHPLIAHRCGMPPLLLARLQYAIDHELAFTPSDFLVRRTGGLYFNIEEVRKFHSEVITFMADQLKYTEDQRKLFTEQLNRNIHEATLH